MDFANASQALVCFDLMALSTLMVTVDVALPTPLLMMQHALVRDGGFMTKSYHSSSKAQMASTSRCMIRC